MHSNQFKAEMKTIRDRTVTIRLSDTDCVRLAQKAGAVGMTVGDLLQFFIRDLVCSIQSNGSDERDLAAQWFDRVGFELWADNTFLRWLIRHGDVQEFIGHYEVLQECQEDLNDKEPVNSREDNLQEIEYQKGWLESTYNEYTADTYAPEPYEAAVERVLQWNQELHNLQFQSHPTEIERKRAAIAKIFEIPNESAVPQETVENNMVPEMDYEPEM